MADRSNSNENRSLAYYKHTTPISTRWSDNDQYGHLNNSIYYHLFDAIVNQFLITQCGLNTNSSTGDDVPGGGPIGLVVASGCRYHAALSFPEPLIGALSVAKLGTSSVTYHIGIFKDTKSAGAVSGKNDKEELAAASGWFTHVFVDPVTRRPGRMTKQCRAAFLRIATNEVKQQQQQQQQTQSKIDVQKGKL